MKIAIGMLIFIAHTIAWGFLIGIGFWLGHKLTDKADNALNRRLAHKCRLEAEQEGAKNG